jgi:ribose 5-phosphate isomerase B
LKEELLTQLRTAGHEVIDFGAHQLKNDDDYPDFVIPLAKAVVAGGPDREGETKKSEPNFSSPKVP